MKKTIKEWAQQQQQQQRIDGGRTQERAERSRKRPSQSGPAGAERRSPMLTVLGIRTKVMTHFGLGVDERKESFLRSLTGGALGVERAELKRGKNF